VEKWAEKKRGRWAAPGGKEKERGRGPREAAAQGRVRVLFSGFHFTNHLKFNSILF
jgi:hypothetical protein